MPMTGAPREAGLLKQRLLAPRPELLIYPIWWAWGSGEGPRICISNKSPGDADAAGPGTELLEPLA